jgi:hypothetical protein
MFNTKPSEQLALLDVIPPQSSNTTVTTAWVNAGNFHSILANILVGVFGSSATVDAKMQQAVDSSGTSSKDVTGYSITQLLAAGGNNREAVINMRTSALDVSGGFGYVRLSVTVGTAATLVSGTLHGAFPRFMDAGASFNNASVAQVV